MALVRRGDGTRAAKILRILNPIERARDPETVWRYGLEPTWSQLTCTDCPGGSVRGLVLVYGFSGVDVRAWVEEVWV